MAARPKGRDRPPNTEKACVTALYSWRRWGQSAGFSIPTKYRSGLTNRNGLRVPTIPHLSLPVQVFPRGRRRGPP